MNLSESFTNQEELIYLNNQPIGHGICNGTIGGIVEIPQHNREYTAHNIKSLGITTNHFR